MDSLCILSRNYVSLRQLVPIPFYRSSLGFARLLFLWLLLLLLLFRRWLFFFLFFHFWSGFVNYLRCRWFMWLIHFLCWLGSRGSLVIFTILYLFLFNFSLSLCLLILLLCLFIVIVLPGFPAIFCWLFDVLHLFVIAQWLLLFLSLILDVSFYIPRVILLLIVFGFVVVSIISILLITSFLSIFSIIKFVMCLLFPVYFQRTSRMILIFAITFYSLEY